MFNIDMVRPSSKDVFGPFTTLGSLPIDVLGGHLDIAGLAVDAAIELLAF